jgi:hypothetical protein
MMSAILPKFISPDSCEKMPNATLYDFCNMANTKTSE